jgi:hypothetical protein
MLVADTGSQAPRESGNVFSQAGQVTRGMLESEAQQSTGKNLQWILIPAVHSVTM